MSGFNVSLQVVFTCWPVANVSSILGKNFHNIKVIFFSLQSDRQVSTYANCATPS